MCLETFGDVDVARDSFFLTASVSLSSVCLSQGLESSVKAVEDMANEACPGAFHHR